MRYRIQHPKAKLHIGDVCDKRSLDYAIGVVDYVIHSVTTPLSLEKTPQ